jgi:hypothetical protein
MAEGFILNDRNHLIQGTPVFGAPHLRTVRQRGTRASRVRSDGAPRLHERELILGSCRHQVNDVRYLQGKPQLHRPRIEGRPKQPGRFFGPIPTRSVARGKTRGRYHVSQQPDVKAWIARVQAEFREMPGLRLTERQMQRLWGLDEDTCAVVVDALLTERILVKDASSRIRSRVAPASTR